MPSIPDSLKQHRVHSADPAGVIGGAVRYAPLKSLWFSAMAGAALIGGIATFSWAAFAIFLAATILVLLFGHSLGSHRKLIHNSFQCPKWLEYTLVYCGVQVGLAGRFLEHTWMLQQLPPALALFAIGGWAFVFWGVCARITAGIFGHWLIGYFAHNHGPMHAEVHGAAVQGHNIRFVSLLTMGECWHNNHHAYPGSACLGLYAGEWDPAWWTLLLLRRAGLAWDLRLPHQLPQRPELRKLDTLPHSPCIAPPLMGTIST